MYRHFSALFLLLLTGCQPRVCREYAEAPKPLSFENRVIAQGGEPAAWRSELLNALEERLPIGDFAASAKIPGGVLITSGTLPALPGESAERLSVDNVGIESLLDGARIPAFFVYERVASWNDPVDIIVLLYGHGSGGATTLSLRPALSETVLRLAATGKVVLVPGIRSLGGFGVGGVNHRAYYRGKGDGVFLKEVMVDTLSAIRYVRKSFPRHRSVTVVGHSLGGYVAVHLAAVDPSLAGAFVSGFFVPYACVNSGYHDGCQRFAGLQERADFFDVAGLIAPRPLAVHYGAQDRHYTPAVDAAYARTEAIYERLAAPAAVSFVLTPDLGHDIDPAAVLRFVESLRQ